MLPPVVAQTLPPWFRELIPGEVGARLADALHGRAAPSTFASLSYSGRLLGLARALATARAPVLVVVPDDREARRVAEALAALLGDVVPRAGVPVTRLPPMDADPYRGLPLHPSIAARRVGALSVLAGDEPAVVVAAADALIVPVPSRETIRSWRIRLAVGDEVELGPMFGRAVGMGYRVVDVVGAPGDIARRGGLFDLWPPQEPEPVRVELDADQVVSIRAFDPATQRTTGRREAVEILPARETVLDPEREDALLDRLLGAARRVLDDERAVGAEGPGRGRLAGVEAAVRAFADDLVTLQDLAGGRLVAWEPDEIAQRLERAFDERQAAWDERVETSGLDWPPPGELFEPPERIAPELARAPLAVSQVALAAGGRELVELPSRPAPVLVERLGELGTVLGEATRAGRPAVLVARAPGRRQRLAELVAEAGLAARLDVPDDPLPPGPGEIVIAPGLLEEGVDLVPDGPLVLGERELFGPEAPPPPRRRRVEKAFVSDLRDLSPGDLVVHVDHGVGRYAGLETRPGTGEELLLLEYAGGDRLYVPVTRLDLIQKYSAGERSLMPLDKLGGPGWARRRSRARRAVAEIAGELLRLYAERQALRARAFGEDTPWQREFEQAFAHELTPDQRAALAEIKADLASGRPMDRLLCGDVGYGKTEVAMRAAFKVVQQGFQVAVLVPTTVLAAQHLATFRARMAAWPVRIEMISRFASPADARERLEATARGEVDILIGTHRLLSRDVSFRRLGLLIIDEEQRFGVRHKERIKQLAAGVHVLAMSATPIPRTLQMSLAGVRDLSVIETPPRNRLAIETRLVPWSRAIVAAAVRNELRRGGQVYFVHPRVEDIEQVTAELRELVPEARIAHAHGQMPERLLERAMLDFVQGRLDVLVATTIIENGLDIPRANTILVNQAHRFGLAQLYQMRGRVGRSDQRAYAYLLIPSRRELTAEARRRLAALVEFSDLGAGFRIAALDLEIRGAGEFLGARQSGHIAAVGFEMYARMLEREVRRLRGEELPHAPEPVAINLGVPARIPEELVPVPGERLSIYKRLASAETPGEIDALGAEIEDRFGAPPAEVRNLLRLARLRLEAAAQGAISIDWLDGQVAVRYGERPRVDPDKIVRLMREDDAVRMTPAGIVKFRLPEAGSDRIAAASLALRKLAG
ncbi:MAG: transcription-repair coupling factor [Acidobacteria bacterium]|nr:MAG: transcription-repair coupling factor [Acidobacteriota bacterium]